MGKKKNNVIYSRMSRAKVYHKEGCPHVEQLSDKYRAFSTEEELSNSGFHRCKHCFGLYHKKPNQTREIYKLMASNRMKIRVYNEIIYVQTKIGFWKLNYSINKEKYSTYHANTTEGASLKNGAKAYHKQKDLKEKKSLYQILKYIDQHDLYRMQVQNAEGNEGRVQILKKYEVGRKRRMQAQASRRLTMLFQQIECEHPEYRQLAIY